MSLSYNTSQNSSCTSRTYDQIQNIIYMCTFLNSYNSLLNGKIHVVSELLCIIESNNTITCTIIVYAVIVYAPIVKSM